MELTFSKGERYPLAIFLGEDSGNEFQVSTSVIPDQSENTPLSADDSFWEKIHSIQSDFQDSLDTHDPEKATNALLELDGTIWKEQQNLENPEFISQARDILRDMIVLFGTSLAVAPGNTADSLAPVVDHLIKIRDQFRKTSKWAEADSIRDCLLKANIVIEDTDDGSRWHVNE